MDFAPEEKLAGRLTDSTGRASDGLPGGVFDHLRDGRSDSNTTQPAEFPAGRMTTDLPDAVSEGPSDMPSGIEGASLARLAVVDGVVGELLAGLATCLAAEAFELVVGLTRLGSRFEGLVMRALARLGELRPAAGLCVGEEPDEPYSPYLGDELAAELGQSPRTMTSRLDQACDVAHRLPTALAALAAGDLDVTRLRAMHALTHALTDGQRATVETQMLAGSRLKSPTQWRRKIHRMVTSLDPDAATRRRKQAQAKRDVTFEPADDGMAELRAFLPAEDARAIFDLVDHAARTDAGPPSDARHHDRRPIGARRADVLTALLLGNRRERVTVEIQIIAPIGTLAGLDNQPTELVGYGPIPADIGRALAADARWRRVLTDPRSGTVLDLGHRRTPTPALARLIRHRDTRCVFPGCAMPATTCDLDHTQPWAQGGSTATNNLNLLCRRHHVMKHNSPCWHLDQPEPGVFIWTAPTGTRHLVDNTTNDEEGLLPHRDHRTWKGTVHAAPPTIADRSNKNKRQPDDYPCPF